MTAELVRGQNHPLDDNVNGLEIRVAAGHPVLVCVTCADGQGAVTGRSIAHAGAPALPGIEVPRATGPFPRCTVDLAAVPDGVHRVGVVLALPEGAPGPARFGATAAPHLVVIGRDGAELAGFTISALDTETALVALELYRHRAGWKVRAVGQGYADGLARLLADQGVPEARETAAAIQRAAAPPAPGGGTPYPPTGAARTRAGRTNDATAVAGGPGAGAGPTRTDGRIPAGPDGRTTGGSGASGDSEAPGDSGNSGAVRQPPAARGGPISYTHPRRRPAPPAAPTSTPTPVSAPAPAPSAPSGPVAGDATGWSLEERLYNQVWGMFEDLARSVAAHRSAVEFAESRLDDELDRALADPRGRIGGAADAAREAAHAKCEQLTARARQALDRDLAQLSAESEVVEPALPPACARWDNPVWHGYRAPDGPPLAVRLGDLTLPEAPGLIIPFLVRLPLERGLWVDSGHTSSAAPLLDGDGLRRAALDCAVAHAARLAAVHPPGDLTLHVVDPAGTGAAALAPLVASGVLTAPPAAGAQGVAATLAHLTERVDLVTMALRGGAPDALPPGLDPAGQLLIVNDFPHGFDDRSVARLRYLADEGPAAGVQLLLVADREDAAGFGPELDPLWRSLLRITAVPDDHLADPWVRHAWTYRPLTVPPGSAVLRQVLDQVAAARRAGRDGA
ncbi:TerD family protein [Streptomyces yaizuensis]|uniref:TerD family protein n=1 Tax=Streptomyces yaizuensis TaxID=2989713 RepID=A0ABQ5P7L0_9ACTN|nr:TerD family protein [Streptomyces sp. YSPA8]GLF98581.1 TerD family protein [Streptomyces sp. YSPA8]